MDDETPLLEPVDQHVIPKDENTHLSERLNKSLTNIFTSRLGFRYGILTYISHKNQSTLGKYTIHGDYG